MNIDTLTKILSMVADGALPVGQAADQLKHLSFEDIGCAHVDHHRALRKGFPEVIFGQGKTSGQIIAILEKLAQSENIVLVTRIDPEKAEMVLSRFPNAQYFDDAHLLKIEKQPPEITGQGTILIVSAGTSDIPVVMEASLTAKAMGNRVETLFDVGVAGIHRLFAHKADLEEASVIIVAAGMEGALPSVVGGLVKSPVIAVPTSVGYGTSFNGLTALLGMLNSCSSNIAVVNIDNGFGAGYMASTINHVGVEK
ncbi:nickel pincer cofactor biosynthesis protein LarB [Desulfobacter curvatus]|uniref:nickel pincer cofactor biosynthesis protein LarB n=1 Tax=Desulfobacter curvatus TaxID=2290 RepID=UPI00037D82C2|nr:nickel pincer cofactor biosynthesis protein LarB [Desulfobacter curvatus]